MRIIGLVLAALLTGCLPTSGYQGGYATSYGYRAGTGVYVNGQEISMQDKALLEDLVGDVISPGRYTIDAQGNAGLEGQPPVVNLVELARRRQQGQPASGTKEPPFSMYSTDSAGRGSSFVSDGDCMIVSTPSGSLSSGC